MEFQINNTYGFWEGGGHDNHLFDNSLANELLSLFKNLKIKNILDLGCGTGDYTKFFISNGIVCDGYDGNPNTPEVSDGVCGVINLAHPIDLGNKFDCVLSLEVGEHLPKEYEDIFIQNLDKHSTGLIIISWAIPGQGGGGHFNEQSNEYITEKFIKLGYVRNYDMEAPLRRSPKYHWFKNTIMVFIKK
jgi:cyclopropane fatty-acyl-phospholipid synthase-like methyltransferase